MDGDRLLGLDGRGAGIAAPGLQLVALVDPVDLLWIRRQPPYL